MEDHGMDGGLERSSRPSSISILHCSDREFMDRFHPDLIESEERVIILSPFLSPGRTSRYCAVFRALNVRGVPVMVYARAQGEQPEQLRPTYGSVRSALASAGVEVAVRAGMHEKVAAIDDRVLWHGSLNILSHNNTRESMLRFESPALLREVLSELGIPGYTSEPRDKQTDAPVEVSAGPAPPQCRECGAPMRLYDEAGLWVCTNGPSCPGVEPADVTPGPGLTVARPAGLDCPICGAPMAARRGVFPSVACSVPACGFELDRRLAAAVLRILFRGGFPTKVNQ